MIIMKRRREREGARSAACTWNAYVGLRHRCLLLVIQLPWEKFEISIICVGASCSFPLPPPLHYYHTLLSLVKSPI